MALLTDLAVRHRMSPARRHLGLSALAVCYRLVLEGLLGEFSGPVRVKTRRRVEIERPLGCSSLRDCFATPQLQRGVDARPVGK